MGIQVATTKTDQNVSAVRCLLVHLLMSALGDSRTFPPLLAKVWNALINGHNTRQMTDIRCEATLAGGPLGGRRDPRSHRTGYLGRADHPPYWGEALPKTRERRATRPRG